MLKTEKSVINTIYVQNRLNVWKNEVDCDFSLFYPGFNIAQLRPVLPNLNV